MWSRLALRNLPRRALPQQWRAVQANSNIGPIASVCRFFADKKVPLPSLGAESITEGEVMEWNKAVGDHVNEGDILCSIETDKVTVEVEAPFSGVITALHVNEGDSVEVGNDLLTIDEGASGGGGGGGSAAPAAEKAAPAAEPAAPASGGGGGSGKSVEVPLKDLGAESITEGEIQEWLKNVGDAVKQGEAICSIETDKVTVDVESPVDGVMEAHLAAAGDQVEIGAILAKITEGASAGGGAAPAAASSPAASAPKAAASTPAPESKSMLRDGFAKAAADRAGGGAASAPASAPASGGGSAPAPPKPVKGSRGEKRVKMTRMRQAIATALKNSQNTTAFLTTFQEVDMTNVMEFRNTYKDQWLKEHGIKFGFMSIFTKAAQQALVEIPAINARIDDATNEIVYPDYNDISIAVASPRGLLTPVVRNAEAQSFLQLEQSIADLAKKAREDKIGMDELSGGTFSISNGGVFGSMMGTPIIPPGMSAILGMHATKDRAMVVDGEIRIRPVMYLALTYDHRIVDGREAVTFLVSMKKRLEEPWRMNEDN